MSDNNYHIISIDQISYQLSLGELTVCYNRHGLLQALNFYVRGGGHSVSYYTNNRYGIKYRWGLTICYHTNDKIIIRYYLGYPERCHNYGFISNRRRLHYCLFRLSPIILRSFSIWKNVGRLPFWEKNEVFFHFEKIEVVFN